MIFPINKTPKETPTLTLGLNLFLTSYKKMRNNKITERENYNGGLTSHAQIMPQV